MAKLKLGSASLGNPEGTAGFSEGLLECAGGGYLIFAKESRFLSVSRKALYMLSCTIFSGSCTRRIASS